MKIFNKIMILASLPEILKLAGTVVDRMLKFFDIEIGDEL